MLVVIDYRVGNVKSVCNALDHIGCEATLSRAEADIENADGIILPGVASFGYAAGQLGEAGRYIQAAAAATPVLGICVGCQLLFDYGTEHGRCAGLGLIGGSVVAIPCGAPPAARRVPHMGWNEVTVAEGDPLFAGLRRREHFYFAHSYYAQVTDSEAEVAYADYDGLAIPAVIRKDRSYGLQFHPEKSGPAGLSVLKNFDSICRGEGGRC